MSSPSSPSESRRAAKSGPLCYFCGGAEGSEESKVIVNLHGDVVETPVKGATVQKTWGRAAVEVPRCEACRWHHENPLDEENPDTKTSALLGLGVAIPIFFIGYAWAWIASMGGDSREFLSGSFIAGGVALAVGFLVGGINEVRKNMIRTAAKPLESVLVFPGVQAHFGKGWSFGSGPGKDDRFAPPTTTTDGAEHSESVYTGCPTCGLAHWWKENRCELCEPLNEPNSAEPVDWNATHEALVILMRLPAASVSRVVEAFVAGNREGAAELLVAAGAAADDARRVVLAWEKPQRAA